MRAPELPGMALVASTSESTAKTTDVRPRSRQQTTGREVVSLDMPSPMPSASARGPGKPAKQRGGSSRPPLVASQEALEGPRLGEDAMRFSSASAMSLMSGLGGEHQAALEKKMNRFAGKRTDNPINAQDAVLPPSVARMLRRIVLRHAGEAINTWRENVDFLVRRRALGRRFLSIVFGGVQEQCFYAWVELIRKRDLQRQRRANALANVVLGIASGGSVTIISLICSALTKRHCADMRDSAGESMLHRACKHGHYALTKYLVLECRMKPEDRDHKGYSALHHAMFGKHDDVARMLMKILIARGKDPMSLRDNHGFEPPNLFNFHLSQNEQIQQLKERPTSEVPASGFVGDVKRELKRIETARLGKERSGVGGSSNNLSVTATAFFISSLSSLCGKPKDQFSLEANPDEEADPLDTEVPEK